MLLPSPDLATILHILKANKWSTLLCSPIILYLVRTFLFNRRSSRQTLIPCQSERVLVVGATSGVGEALAKTYAARGARVAIVGRRDTEIQRVLSECQVLSNAHPKEDCDILGLPADFANPDQMVGVRNQIEKAWGGLDTVHVCAGVSALRPLLEIAEYDRMDSTSSTTVEGITKTVSIANKALQGNFHGPMVTALACIPLLIATSKSPSISLINSLASLIPAPTRSLYCSTKASSLLLYEALAIEHPKIAFSFIIPSTIEGSFRASAVDGGPVREADPNKSGLKRAEVVQACMDAVDRGIKFVWLPWWMSIGHVLYLWWPKLIEKKASKKYSFT